MFSPYYAFARRRAPVGPLNHCAINVVLYRRRGGRWAMTERGARQLSRATDSLAIGPSSMRWDGSALDVRIDERCAPVPLRLRGNVRLYPTVWPQRTFALDAGQRHIWTPLAPAARVEVAFREPALRWTGHGYLDCNRGAEPLEQAFRDWTWSRLAGTERPVLLYDTRARDGSSTSLALRFDRAGEACEIPPPPVRRLPSSRWRIARETRADHGADVRVIKTLVDAPFYSRSLLQTRVDGVAARAVHESLDLDRFSARWVQCLLPFRMPRVTF